jgi:adenosylcobinamide kinase/adenosylcobinamide-phosphate guanylyltransferase
MAAWGAHVPRDGEHIQIAPANPRPSRSPRRILVTGGARSGKSRWAESLVANQPDVVYVATARPRPGDEEWEQRIDLHRRRRPSSWRTVETQEVAKTIADEKVTLVECATLWLAAALEGADVDARIDELVDAISQHQGTVVVVTNEVGSGVVPGTESGRGFRDALGALNARLARECDEVWLVTAGIAQRLS